MGTAWFDGEEEEKEKGVAQGLRRPAGECVCEDPLHYLLRVIYGPRSSEAPPTRPRRDPAWRKRWQSRIKRPSFPT
ncbi:unnamed protein product [Tetraodon nigroviridis]|uniref:(spotted green pufferfish) hypothetical protein n=1 Tax=Tetraodon nigroviridis TaxID=99883 RepID=Q4S5Z1_TETNG|nr:unnamed protein product [Tetraodon nigroviridis]